MPWTINAWKAEGFRESCSALLERNLRSLDPAVRATGPMRVAPWGPAWSGQRGVHHIDLPTQEVSAAGPAFLEAVNGGLEYEASS